MTLCDILLCASACGFAASGLGEDTVFRDEFTVKPVLHEGDSGSDVTSSVVGDTKVKAERQLRKCFKCGGEGTLVVTVREDCDRCDGTGIYITEVELKDTEHTFDGWWGPRTKKTTRKAQNKQPCPRCGRRGKVSVKKETECPMCKGKGER